MAENDQITELTPKQERLIEALLAGQNITLAAKSSGVADKTARRWLKLAHFQAAYKAAQKRMFDTALNTLCLGVEDALNALQHHIKADVEPTAATQLAASKTWLEQSITIYKAAELEEKIAELEQVVKDTGLMR